MKSEDIIAGALFILPSILYSSLKKVRYLPKSESEREQMLQSLGLQNAEELFASIPAAIRLHGALNIPDGISEFELVRYFREWARENASSYTSFLGAGVYSHFRPVVVDALTSRSEFYTAYTPYQARSPRAPCSPSSSSRP